MQNPYPFITNYGATVNYTLTPTTFLEGTYGSSATTAAATVRSTGGILVNDASNRLGSLPGFPLLYPDAGVVDPRYYAYGVLKRPRPGAGRTARDQPAADVRLGHAGMQRQSATCPAAESAVPRLPEYQPDAGRRDQPDEGGAATRSRPASTTTTASRRRTPAPAASPTSAFQGYVNFGNDTNNPLDTGFGFANAALGVFTQYLAAVEADRRQHDLQQHRVLRAGQLEGEQPADARLRPALHAPAAAARSVPADVELLPGAVVAGATRRCSTSPAAATARRSAPATRAMRWIRGPGRS